MASSIFGKRQGNSILAAVSQVRAMGGPQAAFNQMYATNPQFRRFADSMRGKTPEQAFYENGFDYDQFKKFLR